MDWCVIETTGITLSSSIYVVRCGADFVVIDAGQSLEQVQKLIDSLKTAASPNSRILLLFTHCHYDHTGMADRFQKAMTDHHVETIMHAAGAQTLSAGDAQLSGSYIFHAETPNPRIDKQLFHNNAERSCRIPLDDNHVLTCYATPGHSPCSMCIRIGSFLAVGDMLFSTNPSIAGMVGWDRDKLAVSFDFLQTCLSQTDAPDVVFMGHGGCIPTELAKKLLTKQQTALQNLPELKLLDAERALFVRKYTESALVELARIMGILCGRLQALAFRLEQLEEESFVQQLMESIDLHEADILLTKLQHFAQKAANHSIDTIVAIKAMQTIYKIEQQMKASPLQNSTLVFWFERMQRVSRFFSDTIIGDDSDLISAEVDICSIIKERMAMLVQRKTDTTALINSSVTSALFSEQLACQLTDAPVFPDLIIHCHGDDTCFAHTSCAPLCDIIMVPVERLYFAGARHITLTINRQYDSSIHICWQSTEQQKITTPTWPGWMFYDHLASRLNGYYNHTSQGIPSGFTLR